MKTYQNKLDFYSWLYVIITAPRFNASDARALVRLFGEINKDKKRTLTIEDLKLAHEESGDKGYWGDTGYKFVLWAFKDLAPHLRDVIARRLFRQLQEKAGMDKNRYLFAQVRSVRTLDSADKKNGPAVITLVVHSLQQFRDFFPRPDTSWVDVVHGSYDDDCKLP